MHDTEEKWRSYYFHNTKSSMFLSPTARKQWKECQVSSSSLGVVGVTLYITFGALCAIGSLLNTRDRRRAEGRLIFKCKTLQPRGINIDFNFIWANSSSARFKCCHIWIKWRAFSVTASSTDEGTVVPKRLRIFKHFSAKNTRHFNYNQLVSATQFLTMFWFFTLFAIFHARTRSAWSIFVDQNWENFYWLLSTKW